ncbi:CPBP family intramembrane glutamic endopeptidase [Ekhidna sp.]|uniref:CPBP family intramembrane glutamic endopeptidase n=1 Tax=Ekhidna sp. TaxID=2608089 RepID=UPI003518F90A
MIGILVILAISWVLLYFIEKKHLNVLGVTPFYLRVKQFTIGFLLAGLLCVVAQMLEIWIKSADLVLVEGAGFSKVLNGLWWDFKSVLTEELLFRGAILFILIRRIGHKAAIHLSAAAFGVYHWFSYGVFGNPVPMVLIFIGTGLMGFAWALSFHKTKSIMLGLGFHLGWNFVYNTIFSKGPLGKGFLFIEGGNPLSDWASLINFLVPMIGVPLVIILFVLRGVKPSDYHTLQNPDQ